MCLDELIKSYEALNKKLELAILNTRDHSSETIQIMDAQLNDTLNQILGSKFDLAQRIDRIRFCISMVERQLAIDGMEANHFTDTVRSDCDFIEEMLHPQKKEFPKLLRQPINRIKNSQIWGSIFYPASLSKNFQRKY